MLAHIGDKFQSPEGVNHRSQVFESSTKPDDFNTVEQARKEKRRFAELEVKKAQDVQIEQQR